MKLIDINYELICGLGFEVEFAKGDWIGMDDNYLLIDFLCFRLMFTFSDW